MSGPHFPRRPWPVAVVGVGAFGARHARHWASIPEVELAGVCDLQRSRAEQVASALGCPVLRDLEEVASRACPSGLVMYLTNSSARSCFCESLKTESD